MRQRFLVFLALLLFVVVSMTSEAGIGVGRSHAAGGMVLPSHGTVLLVAPHPDDAVLAAGGLLHTAQRSGLNVQVIYVTSGDAFGAAIRASYGVARPQAEDFLALGRMRMGEARAGLKTLGINQSIFLGYPDRGIAHLWTTYGDGTVYRSPSTGQSVVPYADATSHLTPYVGSMLLRDLIGLIERSKPQLLLLPDTADLHGDHWATGAFTLLAVTHVTSHTPGYHPDLYQYLIHAYDWPTPMTAGETPILEPPRHTRRPTGSWVEFPLSPRLRMLKSQALEHHQSQLRVRRDFLRQFVRSNELFLRLNSAALPLALRQSGQ